MQNLLILTVRFFFELLNILIIVRVFLSWVQYDPYNKYIMLIFQLTDPVIEPFKKLMKKLNLRMGMIDISPLVALLAMQFLERILIMLIYAIL